MARGRGQGWEEKVQHQVLKKYLLCSGIKKESIKNEVLLKTSDFNTKESRIDFIVVHPKYLEIVECKPDNHPSYALSTAIGQLLIYRSLVELKKLKNPDSIPGRKKIRLSICVVDGYGGRYNWTNKHKALLKKIEKRLHEKIGVYLVKPKNENKVTEKYCDIPKNQKVEKIK